MNSQEILKYKVNIRKFLKDTALKLLTDFPLGKIYFLLPDKKSGIFRTEFSTNKKQIKITKEGNDTLNLKENKMLCFSHRYSEYNNMSLSEKQVRRNLVRKLKKNKINIVIPLFLDSKIIGLVLFENKTKKGNYKYFLDFAKKIEFGLGSVLIYNWAIERMV